MSKLKEPFVWIWTNVLIRKIRTIVLNYDLSQSKVMELVSLFEKLRMVIGHGICKFSPIEDCKSESGIDFKELADFDDFMVKQINQYPQYHQVLELVVFWVTISQGIRII